MSRIGSITKRVTAVSLVAAMIALFCLTSPARALAVDAECSTGVDIMNFQPALTLSQQSTQLQGEGNNFSTCVITGGITNVVLRSVAANGNLGCLVSTSLSGTAVFSWANSFQNSTVSLGTFVADLTSASKAVTITGTVTAGPFNGDSMTLVYVSTADTTQCAGSGLDSASLTVVSLTFSS